MGVGRWDLTRVLGTRVASSEAVSFRRVVGQETPNKILAKIKKILANFIIQKFKKDDTLWLSWLHSRNAKLDQHTQSNEYNKAHN